MDKPLKERRKHLRICRHFVLSYHEKGIVKAKYGVSQVNNVSQGGINFSSTHPLKQGAAVSIDLQTPFLADPIHLEAVVLESKEKIPGVIFESRLQFEGVSPHVLGILKKIEDYAKAHEIDEYGGKSGSKG